MLLWKALFLPCTLVCFGTVNRQPNVSLHIFRDAAEGKIPKSAFVFWFIFRNLTTVNTVRCRSTNASNSSTHPATRKGTLTSFPVLSYSRCYANLTLYWSNEWKASFRAVWIRSSLVAVCLLNLLRGYSTTFLTKIRGDVSREIFFLSLFN